MSDRKESERIGFDKKFTRQALERLLKERDELLKEYADLSANPENRGNFESVQMIGVRKHREAIDAKIVEVRDWYGIRLLEELEVESRRLKWLTVVLIALTAVLTVFTGFLVSGIRVP